MARAGRKTGLPATHIPLNYVSADSASRPGTARPALKDGRLRCAASNRELLWNPASGLYELCRSKHVVRASRWSFAVPDETDFTHQAPCLGHSGAAPHPKAHSPSDYKATPIERWGIA